MKRMNEITTQSVEYNYYSQKECEQHIQEMKKQGFYVESDYHDTHIYYRKYQKENIFNENETLRKRVEELESLIGAIANIDGAFLTPEGECNYTDKDALKKIDELVLPYWNEMVEQSRKRNNIYRGEI